MAGRFPIPLTSTEPVGSRKPIHHLRINIRRSGWGHELHFGIEELGDGSMGSETIEDYAIRIANSHNDNIQGKNLSPFRIFSALADVIVDFFRRETPYDVKKIDGPACWILLELDGEMNWGFDQGEYGVSMKKVNDGAGDYGLQFVFKNTKPSGPTQHVPVLGTPKNPKPCRVAFWAVPRRRPIDPKGFNFHVAFYQKDIDGDFHKLPTIFDPNVPNDGGAGIP